MSDTISIRFARKPTDIEDVRRVANNSFYDTSEAAIAETVELSAAEYDTFARLMYKDWDWLDGKGGFKQGICQAVAVTAPGRETLYVDPSGHAYARYAGMKTGSSPAAQKPDGTSQQRFERFVQQLTALTKQHGIAIMSIGGVYIFEQIEDAKNLVYSMDASSGDLQFRFSPARRSV